MRARLENAVGPDADRDLAAYVLTMLGVPTVAAPRHPTRRCVRSGRRRLTEGSCMRLVTFTHQDSTRLGEIVNPVIAEPDDTARIEEA